MEMSPTPDNVSAYHRILSNETKQDMLGMLYKEPMSIKALTERLSNNNKKISLSAVSHAVTTLAMHGLVSKRGRGRSHICEANREAVDQFIQAFAAKLHGEAQS